MARVKSLGIFANSVQLELRVEIVVVDSHQSYNTSIPTYLQVVSRMDAIFDEIFPEEVEVPAQAIGEIPAEPVEEASAEPIAKQLSQRDIIHLIPSEILTPTSFYFPRITSTSMFTEWC